jgi:hypothetical protein
MLILGEGSRRFKLNNILTGRPYYMGEIEYLEEEPEEDVNALAEECIALLERVVEAATEGSVGIEIEPPYRNLSFAIAGRVEFEPAIRQQILELTSEQQRLHKVKELLGAEAEARAVARVMETAQIRLSRLQRSLIETVSAARKNRLEVSEGGRVSYDYSRHTAARNDPDYQDFVTKTEQAAKSWQARIDALVKKINETDVSIVRELRTATTDKVTLDGTKNGFNRYADNDIPAKKSAREVKSWWDLQSAERQRELIERYPEEIGNLDGMPAEVRNRANRIYLPQLIEQLQDNPPSKDKLEALKDIQKLLKREKDMPVFLLGLGTEGGGRAIISFGNPDTERNVSAYVPGTGAGLHSEFVKSDGGRARTIADKIKRDGGSAASIVWLGYDAPQLRPDVGVGTTSKAEAGGANLQRFLSGLEATSQEESKRIVTVVGHSYGTLTIG